MRIDELRDDVKRAERHIRHYEREKARINDLIERDYK